MATPSRVAVAHALHRVFGQGARVPETWDAALPPGDAGLANALLGKCLRRWGCLQAFVRPQLREPGRGVPLGTQVALAMGVAQLAWLPGISDHAAVNEAVDLATDRQLGFPPHKGLVNALLRRAAKDRAALRATLDGMDPALDRTPFTARVLQAALAPRGGGPVEALWQRLQTPPRAHFLALREGALPPGLEPAGTLPGDLVLEPEAPFPSDWLAQGAGMVQDLSSQALLQFAWERRVLRVLDACSAPGGKVTSLARRFPGARIIALERHPGRASRLRDNLRLRRVRAEVVVEDAGPWLRRSGAPFDLILLDAPCSGSGTLQKHPELNWLGDALQLRRLVLAQRDLLEAALPRLAPGGLLIYAVCSWLPEEGRGHRDWLAAIHPEWRPAPVWPAGLGTEDGPTSFFRPDPLTWAGEGFQAFALTR
ncbi:MAG: RsmB/NOP family class I SAM-dependent RNA methyltransferase [Holophaga sp.]|jgi:16S rRNA (cytosine967-C5)-methyltransferase